MTYFLDFDRTLFNTDAYNEFLLTHPGTEPLRDRLRAALAEGRDASKLPSAEREALWDDLTTLIESGAVTYEPGELTRFLYDDVPEFFRRFGNDAVIVTYGEMARQKAKVESALAGLPSIPTHYTGRELKRDYLARNPELVSEDARFVDDIAEHLTGLADAFPALELYEMRRDGGAGDGRWPVVHTLAQLP